MSLARRVIDFYRIQVELVWTWRRGRRQLLWRAIVSFALACVSLALTAWLLPGVRVDNVAALAAAVIVIGAFSLLLRPPLLALVAPISIWLMLFIALVWQVAVILALVPIVPGVHLAEPFDAAFAAVVFAALSTLLSWLLALDTDDSYYAALVRRLLSRRRDVNRSRRPGLVIIQIDGLSHDVLQHQVEAGRVPVISRWLSRGLKRLEAWDTLLPSQTSASQAGILFGDNDAIPAFRWFAKDSGTLFVSNRPADAEALEARLVEAGHPGLLANDGASIANLLSGGAPRSYLTLSTMRDPTQGIGRSRSYLSFFLSPYGFVHSIVLGIAEVAKEVFQARRARLAGIEPRLARGFPYPFLRAATNVLLRPMVTSLVIEEILRGTSIIYATYTDYDEVAHHSGPQRAESLDALDGVDRVLGSIARAAADAPRPYHLVVLSDHGQTLGATFRQRYGRPLEELLRQLMGGTESVAAAVGELEQWRVLNSFVAELARARGTARITRGALRTRDRRRAQRALRTGGEPAAAEPESADLVVCASGNLALVYFPAITGRASLEAINDQHPDMVDALANHPGVGLVMVRSEAHGSLVIGHSGVHHLADGAIEGEDPLAQFGEHAAQALAKLDAMPNCGDLVLISALDPSTGQIAAFEELIGSHGGLGGPQTDAFLLYPSDWELDGELVGALAVNTQLKRWLRDAGPENSVIDPGELDEVRAR